MEDFQTFLYKDGIERKDARNVATWSIQASYKAAFDRIKAGKENDRE